MEGIGTGASAALASNYFQIVGAWTKAGVASCVHICGRNSRTDNFLLDCGVIHPESFSANAVFITHGHLDHAGSAIQHARSKALSSKPSTYYIPKAIEDAFLLAKHAFEQMDGREIPMIIQTVQPGDEIIVSQYVRVKVFATEHRVPSQGYMFYSMNTKLLPQYQQCNGLELKALRSEGVEINTVIEHLQLVYTGDTTFRGLISNSCRDLIFTAPILITELTYLDDDPAKADKWKHIHIQDIVDHQVVFQNEVIVFVHVSQKYSMSRAIELLRFQLTPHFLERVMISLHSFGSEEVLTSVLDTKWRLAQRQVAGWGWSNVRSHNANAVVVPSSVLSSRSMHSTNSQTRRPNQSSRTIRPKSSTPRRPSLPAGSNSNRRPSGDSLNRPKKKKNKDHS